MKQHLYKVYYSYLARSYRTNSVFHVVAPSVIEAAEMCETELMKRDVPEFKVWNITHAGEVEYIHPKSLKALLTNNK